MKKCKKCKIEYEFPTKHFNKGGGQDGLRFICKKCQLEYNRMYRDKNKEKIRERDKKYYEKNKKKIKVTAKKYRQKNKNKIKKYYEDHKEDIRKKHIIWKNKNKDHIAKYSRNRNLINKEEKKVYNRKYHIEHRDELNKKSREYYYENKDKIRAYEKYRRETDPNYRIRLNLNKRVRSALKSQKIIKTNKTMDLVGCTIQELKIHLENLFTEGMTWNNYGVNGWTLDHIRPCISFDLTDIEQQKECFNYKNLQPLWWKDNSSKSSRYKDVIMRSNMKRNGSEKS